MLGKVARGDKINSLQTQIKTLSGELEKNDIRIQEGKEEFDPLEPDDSYGGSLGNAIAQA